MRISPRSADGDSVAMRHRWRVRRESEGGAEHGSVENKKQVCELQAH